MYRYDKEEIRHSIAFIQDPSRMHGVAYGTRKLTLSNGRQVEVYNDYVKAGGGVGAAPEAGMGDGGTDEAEHPAEDAQALLVRARGRG